MGRANSAIDVIHKIAQINEGGKFDHALESLASSCAAIAGQAKTHLDEHIFPELEALTQQRNGAQAQLEETRVLKNKLERSHQSTEWADSTIDDLSKMLSMLSGDIARLECQKRHISEYCAKTAALGRQ